MPFKMHKIVFFSIKKYVYLPFQKSDRNTLLFYLALAFYEVIFPGPPPRYECVTENYFLISQPKHVVGTQKNRLIFEHPKHMFKLMDKKIITILCLNFLVRPNKKMPVFRVTRPYLNLLMKPRFFFRFSGKKKHYFMHFERRNAFQNA